MALASALLLASPHSSCIAAPSPAPAAAGQPGLTLPLTRRTPVRTIDDWEAWAQREREFLTLRYGGGESSQRRSEGINL